MRARTKLSKPSLSQDRLDHKDWGIRKVKLLNLTLKNFKGCKRLELRPEGQDVRIFGDNSTFKTTIFDAFTWLLFDKDSNNRTDFAIKTLDKEGNVIHHLDHEVEGVFEVGDETITLRKVYREKWVKRRGSASQEFSGHETDYYLDDVPAKKAEYTTRVNQIAPEERFKLLTSPTYFNDQMHWSARRDLLMEVCGGDVTMEQVIEVEPQLKDLPKILGKRDPEDHKKVVVEKRNQVNKEIERIPIRIDEVHQGLPDISAIENPDAVESDLAKLAKAKAEKEAELAKLLNGGNQGETKQQVAQLEAEMLTIETAYKREHAKNVGEIESKIKDCQDTIRDVQDKVSTKQTALESSRKSIEVIEQSIVDLRAKWHKVNDRELELCVDETCPTCGQDLPADKVQSARDKAVADFNASKAQQLADINTAGKAGKVELEKVTEKITQLENEIAELESSLETLAENNAKLNGDLAKTNATSEDYKDLADYKELVASRDKLQKQLDGERVDISPEKERIETEIKMFGDAQDAINEAKANLKLHEQGKKRIAELESQKKELAKEFEKLERDLYLLELYIRTRAELLTGKINAKFKLAKFNLFEAQVNGGVNPICETTYKGVPWGSGLNNAARINVGLDIINTLSEHYGFTPPIFVDNAEAVTKLVDVDAQLISLIVSEEDKTLRIEGQGEVAPTLEGQASLFQEAI